MDLSKYEGPDEVVALSVLRETAGKAIGAWKAKVGIWPLDQLLDGGICAGELYVISGPPKHGKTTLAQTVTNGLYVNGIYSLWFSFEVPISQWLSQVPRSLEGYAPKSLVREMDWIRNRILEAKQKYGIKCVFIDHLGYIVDLCKIRNPSIELGSIVRSLKQICIEQELVIFLLHHVRKVEGGKEVTEDDLRDSGLITGEADSTWIITRLIDKATKEATTQCRVRVGNHRRTGVMGKSVILAKSDKLFVASGEDPDTKLEPEETKFYEPEQQEVPF